jgi:rhodanese-related sulfurtransferase
MDATTAAAQLDDLVVVDVREPDEWVAGHIANSRPFPMSELAERQSELEELGDGSARFLFVCTMGGRSAQATQYFTSRLGLDAENLEGGLLAWTQAGHPLVTDDGTPGVVAQH